MATKTLAPLSLAAMAALCLACDGGTIGGTDTGQPDPGDQSGSPDQTAPDQSTDPDALASDSTSDGTSSPDSSPLDTALSDTSRPTDTSVPPVDMANPTCPAGDISNRITTTTFATPDRSNGNLVADSHPDGGAVAAWVASDGVHATRLNSAGAVVSDITVDGDMVFGVAANDTHVALLVRQAPDIAAFVQATYDGTITSELTLAGGVGQNQEGDEWLDDWRPQGRVMWSESESEYAAYFAIKRVWPDMIGHQGDTLRRFDAAGVQTDVVWGWGCSHSLDQLLVHNGTTWGSVCVSDCFPDKGIFADHNDLLYADPSGNCSGGSSSRLGGIAPVADGFWVTFSTEEGRSSQDVALLKFDNSYDVVSELWLTSADGAEGSSRLAPFEGGLLAAWEEGGSTMLQTHDAAGAVRESAVAVGVGLEYDFFAFANGDVGWAVKNGGSDADLVRVQACP